jgi:hypothetical protein
MKVFVVHVYDAADHQHDYYVRQTVKSAVRQAAVDVVTGRFEEADPSFFEVELQRVIDAVSEEPGVGRWHVRCDAWRAHVDQMEVLGDAATPLPAVDRESFGITWRLRSFLGGSGTAMTTASELRSVNDPSAPALYDVLRDAANEIDCLNAEIATLIGRAAAHQRIDDVVIDELAKGSGAAAAAACKLTAALRTKEQDHAHLRRLYAESRDYVGALQRERDELVVASRRDGAEIDRLEAEVEALRRQVGR